MLRQAYTIYRSMEQEATIMVPLRLLIQLPLQVKLRIQLPLQVKLLCYGNFSHLELGIRCLCSCALAILVIFAWSRLVENVFYFSFQGFAFKMP